MLQQANWVFHRLRCVNLDEIGWRTRQIIRIAHRRRQFRAPLEPLEAARLLCPDLLVAGPQLPEPSEVWPLPTPLDSADDDPALKLLANGQWEVFGHLVCINPPEAIQWQRDPITGQCWEQGFGPDICLTGPTAAGEPRAVWELNRLAFCYLLVAPEAPWSLVSGLERCQRLVASWSHANPVYWGINWYSGMEAAIRLIHLSWTLLAVRRQAPGLAEHLAFQWWPLLCAHAGFVLDRLSLYSSANNHLLFELASLLIITALARPASTRWRQRVHRWEKELARQLHRQFDSRGVNQEHSSGYQRFALQALELINISGVIRDPELRARLTDILQYGGHFLGELIGTNGKTFSFGDCDEGLLFAGWSALRHAERTTSRRAVTNWSGYLFARAGEWEVFLDAAQDGLPPLYGHAHSDLLAIQVCFRGQLVIGDPGTYAYLSNPSLRLELRSRAAHSVFGPVGWEPMRFQGSFLVEPARGERKSVCDVADGWSWIWGAHCCHPNYWMERAVLSAPGFGCLVIDRALPTRREIEDELTCWESRLRLAPGWQATKATNGGWCLVNPEADLALSAHLSAPVRLQQRMELMPYSPTFQHVIETPALIATVKAGPNVTLLIHFAPLEIPVQFGWAEHGCQIETPGWFCYIATSPNGVLSASCLRPQDPNGTLVHFSGQEICCCHFSGVE